MIEITGVSKTYEDETVLDDVNLVLPDSGITAIVGPNGAGKSTLLSIIARLLAPSAGTVLVDGLDVQKTKSEVLAKRLAILRQANQVGMRLTVEELVTFGRFPHCAGRPTAQDERHVREAIAYLGLETLSGRFLDELSGGQRQRAFVAMVLAQDTNYVLLDEPLNSLDMKHAAAMMKLLRRAADTFDKSIIIVIHDINFASIYADRIIAMRDGRVVLEGTPDTFMREPVLQDIYDTRIDVHEVDGHRLGMHYL
ncbi:ABC transporter ATP-binding protein [Nitratireductor pacificus]|uniref:Ferric siderophore ABC transporter ATP-binding protein n=1 Tax=Nitratireductor pacificus pht-3B TaxID=391937 RepID=K2M8H3_9HYPH|nr:ATP-binding cassette domain-containing protein [Nitratireductor pacificus]EKF18471.1 ferric siderophore ABC transporter ATP-binding protein [Nitratireductor pacificus pht-3B]